MGSGLSQCVYLLQKPRLKNSSIIISKEIISLVPDFNSQNDNINSLTSVFVTNLLEEAEHKLNSNEYNEYNKSINLLSRAMQLGSVRGAAKLGSIYLNGFNNDDTTILPDYDSAAACYFVALKFTLMIPHASWDIDLILDTVLALTKLYTSQLGNPNNLDVLNYGLKLMSEIDKNLQVPYFARICSYKQNQKRRATRIHINYCLAITAESKGDILEALKGFEECELIGQCGIENADNLIKKTYSCIQRLDSTRPVNPICVQCNYEARDLIDVLNLSICTKCNINVACCGIECLNKHIMTIHSERS